MGELSYEMKLKNGELNYESKLKFWQDNLKREEERLSMLLKFSRGVIHTPIMESKKKIEQFKKEIEELENGQI